MSGSLVAEILLLPADAVPSGMVEFSGFTIDGMVDPPTDHLPVPFSVSFEACKFISEVTLSGQFQGNLSFSDTTFLRGLSLFDANIKGRLLFDDIGKGNASGFVSISLRSAHVDGSVTFDTITGVPPDYVDGNGLSTGSLFFFPAPNTIPAVDFTALQASDATFAASRESRSVDYLKLEGANIKDHLRITDFGIKNLYARGLTVGAQTEIEGRSPITGSADLSLASVGAIRWELSEAGSSTNTKPSAMVMQWPNSMMIDGLSFSKLMVTPPVHLQPGHSPPSDDDPNNQNQIQTLSLEFLKRADFYKPAYLSYQKSLEESGLSDAANRVNNVMHSRLRHEMFHRSQGLLGVIGAVAAATVDRAQGLFFGYGRTLLAPALWSVLFVTTGSWIFRRESDMEAIRADESGAYSGFWYSLEMFLPIIDLGVAKGWRPRRAPKWRLWYARIHQLAGWILIPVAIGTLTGSFK